jgi:hypothetical protein
MKPSITIPLEGGGAVDVEVVAEPGQEALFGRGGRVVGQLATTLENHLGTIRRVATAFRNELADSEVHPDVLKVKFGVEFTADSHVVIASVGTSTAFEVTMEWHRPPAPAGGEAD